MFGSPDEMVSVEGARPRAWCGRWSRTLLTQVLCLSLFVPAGRSLAGLDGPKSSPSKSKPSFNRDVRPILSDNCFYCHGPDPNKRKGKLRLDVRAEALAKQAIVPGKPDESELVRRIS